MKQTIQVFLIFYNKKTTATRLQLKTNSRKCLEICSLNHISERDVMKIVQTLAPHHQKNVVILLCVHKRIALVYCANARALFESVVYCCNDVQGQWQLTTRQKNRDLKNTMGPSTPTSSRNNNNGKNDVF
jgi:hypothetical protein